MLVFHYFLLSSSSSSSSCSCDLDPMTLIHELDLDILKMYPRTKMKFLDQNVQTLEHEQDRQTGGYDRKHCYAACARGNNKQAAHGLRRSAGCNMPIYDHFFGGRF